ncbi:connector enhancer of kinase suppressor of ras 1 [Pyrgilauda ruficollis]|uniref:connector enhancer of kinase suppressor of ras 1 n=1 Tax=Pyrgilauda ruficollis TaxID=221976 RepID=UPI001B865350|nr:connector enhancer of kinase suppressor of ras 1 [Pyrgilauda ruficollis]
MEPVRSWGPAEAAAWLRGLDAAVQGYPFEAWGLSGPDLLGLDAGVLEALGVWPLGHQELLLEALEQLRNLDTRLVSTSLRTLTERLQELARGIQSLVQGGLSAGDAPQPPSLTLLARVIHLVGAAKELFSWLNRYLFSTLNDFSASRDIVLLCAQLAETLQADLPAAERNSSILQICQHIEGICESIVGCSPPALLDRRAVLQRVGLALLPGPQGSPPVSPSTPTLPLGLQQSPPASPDTPTLPLSQWSSPPGSPDTPTAPWSPQGFEITSTSSCLHFVSATTPEALAAHGGHILPGDEIVQVNEQVVVGWTPVSLARKLLENGNRVTLVLKKIPLDLPGSPPSPTQQPPGAFLDAADSPGTRSGESPGSPVSLTSRGEVPAVKQLPFVIHSLGNVLVGLELYLAMTLLPSRNGKACGEPAAAAELGRPGELSWSSGTASLQPLPGAGSAGVPQPEGDQGPRSSGAQGSRFPRSVAADLDSGPESVPDPVTDEEQEEDERDLRLPGAAVEELSAQGAAEEVWDSGSALGTPLDTRLGTPPSTPAATEPCATELSPRAAPATGAGGAEPSPEEGSPSTGRRPKGVATRLSRRRVSCRDLGRVDCDGWLLKKKEHVGFMAQKWKRCWCVLKGHTLYWYNHPNDERAAGLINVATYNLESTREQKKKYVFQLCHQTYKPFVFAAETLADLSMWVSRLVTAKTKYTLAHQAVPDKEEDCYSETEAEDPDEESPRHGSDSPRKRLQNTPEKAQLSPASSAASSPRPCSPMEPGGEDLESLLRSLRQGGVSLTGQQRRALTQEQCRKSFLRRNRNPHINERVHAVRALQSTLKAKLAELQALEQLLGEAELTSDTFRRWKEEHQELYQELREGWAGQQGAGEAAEP